MGQRVEPETVINAVEPLDETLALARVPGTPFAFIWFLIRNHFPGRVAAMAGFALLATSIEAFGPVAFSHLVNAITAAVKSHSDFSAVLPWILWLAAIWFCGSTTYRFYDWVDLNTGPRMRGLAQKYLFVYLLGHAPRYFQDNFAGKLGQKVKQAGQATIGILGIVCMDVVRVSGLVVLGGVLMAIQAPSYAAILLVWTALYLAIVFMLARRCVVLSKALSDEVSTSTGRLIDAVSNADLVRAFAKAVYERKFISYFLLDEMNASRRLRWFLLRMRFFMNTATLILLIALICVTARDILAGAISLGAFTMIYLLANQIGRGVQELGGRMLDYFEQLGTLSEALELVSAPHEIVDVADAKALAVGTGHIVFDNVLVPPSQRFPGVREPESRNPSWRARRACRPVGRGQVHAGAAAAPPVRAAIGPHPDRRTGHRACHMGFAERGDRRGAADARRVPPQCARQYPLRAAARARGRRGRCGAPGLRARLHRRP